VAQKGAYISQTSQMPHEQCSSTLKHKLGIHTCASKLNILYLLKSLSDTRDNTTHAHQYKEEVQTIFGLVMVSYTWPAIHIFKWLKVIVLFNFQFSTDQKKNK